MSRRLNADLENNFSHKCWGQFSARRFSMFSFHQKRKKGLMRKGISCALDPIVYNLRNIENIPLSVSTWKRDWNHSSMHFIEEKWKLLSRKDCTKRMHCGFMESIGFGFGFCQIHFRLSASESCQVPWHVISIDFFLFFLAKCFNINLWLSSVPDEGRQEKYKKVKTSWSQDQ